MKEYIGDGAYVEFDGFAVVLTTSNGIQDTNIIVLEPEVLSAFLRYVDNLKKKAAGT